MEKQNISGETIARHNNVVFDDAAGTQPFEMSGDDIKPTCADNVNVMTDNLERFAEMPVLVDTISWDSTQTAGTKLVSNGYGVRSYLAAATNFAARLTNVSFFRYKKLCIRFVTAADPFANGAMGVCAYPDCGVGRNTIFTDRLAKLGQSTVAYLPIPQEDAIEIKLDWVYPFSAMDLNDVQISASEPCRQSWFIMPYVLSRLYTGALSVTQKVEVFMWLEGFEVLATGESGEGTPMETSDSDPGFEPKKDKLKEVVRKVRPAVTGIGKTILPSPLWDLADGLAEMCGFNVPGDDPGTLSAAPSMTHGGNRNLRSLGNLPNEMGPSLDYDAISFAALATVPTINYEINLAIGTTPSVLTNIALTPFNDNKTAGINQNSVNTWMSLIGHLGRPSNGYRVTIMTFHSKQNARFRLTYVPGAATAPTLSDADKATMPSVTFSLGETGPEGKAIVARGFDIPYASPFNYLDSHDSLVSTTSASIPIMGYLVLELVSDVVGPDTAGDIGLIVTVSANEEMAITGASEWNTLWLPGATTAQQTTPEVGLCRMRDGAAANKWSAAVDDSMPTYDGRCHPFHNVGQLFEFGKKSSLPAVFEGATGAGFPVTSFRQLITKELPGLTNGNGSMNPFLCELANINTTTNPCNTRNVMLNWIRAGFSFETGNIGVAAIPQASALVATAQMVDIDNPLTARTVYDATRAEDDKSAMREIETFPDNPFMQMRVPRYASSVMTPLIPGVEGGSLPWPNLTTCKSVPTNKVSIRLQGTAGDVTTIYATSAMEDYNVYYRRPLPNACSVGGANYT